MYAKPRFFERAMPGQMWQGGIDLPHGRKCSAGNGPQLFPAAVPQSTLLNQISPESPVFPN
jgi:hypothetical protein